MARLQLTIREGQSTLYSGQFTGPVELGRQNLEEPPPFTVIDYPKGQRLIIAESAEISISRRHLYVRADDEGGVYLENLSERVYVGVRLTDGRPGRLEGGDSRTLSLPVQLNIGKLEVNLEPLDNEVSSFAWEVAPPAEEKPDSRQFAQFARQTMMLGEQEGDYPQHLLPWLKDAMQSCTTVFRTALSSDDFFLEGARAVVEIANMDAGRVLLWDGHHWKLQATYVAESNEHEYVGPESHRVLDRVLDEKRTCWQLPRTEDNIRDSIAGVSAVVAAPILDHRKEVIGVLYGDRRPQSFTGLPVANITTLEALFVELLACGIASGLARLELEQAQVQYEQFFTPDLARRLIGQPGMLDGCDRAVSIMFCDISGFSRIAERLTAGPTLDWIRDVLTRLSQCVLNNGGVLVDYVGDEIMAMWGAPDVQDDHAQRACRAALDMMRALPALNDKWQPVIGEPVAVRIGVNSGLARVGNIGSQQKFKYGALGSTVNLAKRVQSVSHHLRSRLLVTAATRGELPEAFANRRLCHALLKGIESPVELYELHDGGEEGWASLKEQYESALANFEAGRLREAISQLGVLLNEHPHDGPTLVLLARSVAALRDGRDTATAVWELAGS